MDIKELQDYRLSDAIKFHTHLNPRIWGPDEHLLPEVREKLLAIAADFKEFLGLDLEVKDITISGSNAAYTYTDHSDIDLHLVADLPKADASEIYRELFDAKKYQYNDQHNFKIGGYDVELYVQNANEDPKSQGIYSVLNNEWISVPKRRKPEVDDISVKSKYEDLGRRIEAAIESGNVEQLDSLGRKIREFRQAGLDRTGEFGPENLAFKILRSNGTLDQLRAARLAAKDRELSIEEAKKKKKKKPFKYGFGGYYYPGYHYYGQTDAAADGGGDGGGESVRESAVFLNPNAVIVGQDHNKPLNLTPDTLKKVQSIAAKHGARYEGNGKDRTYTKGQIDKYVGSWDDEVAKTASPNDPKWLYVLFANVDENNRVQRIGVDAQDTIFNRLLATARDNSFQGIGFTSQALQKFLSMASEGKYDFVKMSQQPATQENLTRFLKAGEALMWPGNWEQYPNKAGKIAKSATVDVRDQYLATRKAGVYVTGSGHLKAVQDITGQQGVAEGSKGVQESTDDLQTQLEKFAAFCVKKLGIRNPPGIQLKRDPEWSKRNATFGRYVPETNIMILSVADRHPMDIMRTLAHELVHRNQDEHEPMPVHAGDTGSKWENEANAKAGVLMRGYGEQNPDTFDKNPLAEGLGKNSYKEIEFVCANPEFPDATDPELQKQMHLGLQQIPGVIPLLQDQSEYSEGQCSLAAIYKDRSTRSQILKLAKRLGVQVDLEQPVSDDYVDRAIRGEHYGQQVVAEASGYIPVNDKEARDPRYSMAITQDIKPGENQRQAAKMGWKTDRAGTPPTAKTNGLVEALTRKLQAVKEGLGFPLVSEQEQELEEVAMSPSALRSFAASPAAEGMRAGFEAELVFTGIGSNEEEGEWEADYSYDPRAYSLENIEDFFASGEFAEGLSRQTKIALENDYMEWYDEALYDEFDAPVAVREWIQENDWDEEDLIERALDDEYSEDRVKEILAAMERRVEGTGTAADADLVEEYLGARQEVERQLDERVDLAIEDQNSDYESALDEFRENWDRSESDWLRDRGWRSMSDIAYNFDVTWPHMTMTGGSSEGGFNEAAAQQLADSLSEALGVETTVSTGYHGATRDTSTWIFEPDGSLDADDDDNMPVEIVSPPMPLAKTLEILPKFFEWAEDNGAYANSSTGFHMSVSMPEHEGNMLDYTKLALFLGDEYVLKQFGREANTYARSAISKIRERKGNVNAETVMSAMRKHLDQFASRALAQPSGFGKYTSINPKSKYIEFRSAGGSNYFEDMDKIQNTLMRYARAMDIAMNPEADKPEYAKKLYKMLTDVKTQEITDPRTGTKRTEVVPGLDNDAIAVFSRFVAGELPKSELKGFIKKIQYGREVARQKTSGQVSADYDPDGNYVIRSKDSEGKPQGPVLHRFSATGTSAAIEQAKQWIEARGIEKSSVHLAHVENVPAEILATAPTAPPTQTPQTDQLNAPVADDPRGNYVLRQREGSAGTGPVVHRFSAPNNMAAVTAAREWTTAQGIERGTVWLDHISGVPPEVLNARPVQATLGEPRPAFTEPRSSSIPEVPLDIAQNFPQAGGEFSGEWKVVDDLNREVYRFGGIGNSQSDANRVAREWAQRTGFDGNLEVYPVMR